MMRDQNQYEDSVPGVEQLRAELNANQEKFTNRVIGCMAVSCSALVVVLLLIGYWATH